MEVGRKGSSLWDRFDVDWVPSLSLGHQKSTKDEASQQQDQGRAQRIVERRKRQLESEVEETFEGKLQKVNEPEAVKDLFDASDIQVVDTEDIPGNLPQNLRNVCTANQYCSSSSSYSNR